MTANFKSRNQIDSIDGEQLYENDKKKIMNWKKLCIGKVRNYGKNYLYRI